MSATAFGDARSIRRAMSSATKGETSRRGLGLIGALGLLAAVALLSIRVGSVTLDTATVFDAFFSFDGSNEHIIVRSLRVPRTLIGLGVGAALAVAGTVTQGVTRNPLGAPDILGVNAGASFAVV